MRKTESNMNRTYNKKHMRIKYKILTVFFSLFFWPILGLTQTQTKTQNGLVQLETKYQDVSNLNQSVTYQGQGFVVEYPITSLITKKSVNLKLVLTAAHLVFGGIYIDELDNYKVLDPKNKTQIHTMAMISDVVHDSASIMLCTKETMDFFKDEFKAHDLDLDQLANGYTGQIFTLGGGCASNQEKGVLVDDVTSFAKYIGPELIFDSFKGTLETSSPSIQTESDSLNKGAMTSPQGKLVVNPNYSGMFLNAGDTYAIPWNESIKNEYLKTYPSNELSSVLKPWTKNYQNLSEVPGEYSLPLSLEAGYSGSPVLTYDSEIDQIVVSGIYKSSTQALNSESYGNFGWASPTELSHGLLNTFLRQYTQTLHRWHTYPQVYLYLNDGELVREMYYQNFILYEDIKKTTPDENQNNPVVSSEWIRSDTGTLLWARTDTGSTYSIYPKKSKSLSMRQRQNPNLSHEVLSSPVLGLSLEVEGDSVLLPPVMEAIHFTTKFNCKSCVNIKSYNPEKVEFLSYDEQNNFIDFLTSKSTKFSKKFTNTSVPKLLGNIEINYNKEADRLKIEILWDSDSITFYILKNNNYLFKAPNGQWYESQYSSVLETQTNSGDMVYLELAGILYFNTELENPNSFRLMIKNLGTQLFSLSDK